MPIKLKANNGNIDLKVPIKQTGGGAVNSVNGQTGDVVLDIPSKTSDLVNDSGFLTEHQSLDEYAKKSELFSKDYNDLTNKPTIPSIDGLATTQYVDEKVGAIDVPSLDGYATESWVEGKGYLTQHQDLSSYAKKSDIPTQPDLTLYALKTEIPDVSGYALKSEIPSLADYSTTTQVQSMINTAIGSITDGNEVSY